MLFLLFLVLTSINEPMPAGMRTSRLVFSSIRYKNIINVLTHLQITAKAKRKCKENRSDARRLLKLIGDHTKDGSIILFTF